MILFPVIIPLFFSAILIPFRKRWGTSAVITSVGLLIQFGASLVLFYQTRQNEFIVSFLGGWPAPFGITFVSDLFSSTMVMVANLIGLTVGFYAIRTIQKDRVKEGFFSLFFVLLMGVNGAFLTGDLFNLYVWFEVMLIASFVLLVLGGTSAQMQGAFKYVTINLISSALFLAGVGILYGKTGTLNMADLAVKMQTISNIELINSSSALLFLSFSIKAALFPVYFWLPDSYFTPPVAVTAVFAGLLTKVGVYSLFRVFTLIFPQDQTFLQTVFLILASLTMVSGVLGAVAQNEIRKILSVHIISQIGYMIIGLALWTSLAISGAIYYIIHNIVVKTNLFMISGIIQKQSGSFELSRNGGLVQRRPFLAALFLISALSLAGLPPLSGFVGKFVLVKAGLEAQNVTIVVVALAVSVLTLFSMNKIWQGTFWGPVPEQSLENGSDTQKDWTLLLPVGILTIATVAMGIGANAVLTLTQNIADQLLNPSLYISNVLGVN